VLIFATLSLNDSLSASAGAGYVTRSRSSRICKRRSSIPSAVLSAAVAVVWWATGPADPLAAGAALGGAGPSEDLCSPDSAGVPVGVAGAGPLKVFRSLGETPRVRVPDLGPGAC
jgi:hypothetical protein